MNSDSLVSNTVDKGRRFEFICEMILRSLGWSVLRNVILFKDMSLSNLAHDPEIDLVGFRNSELIVCSCKSGKFTGDDTFNPFHGRFVRFRIHESNGVSSTYDRGDTLYLPSLILNLPGRWNELLNYFKILSTVGRHEWFERYYWGISLLKRNGNDISQREKIGVLNSLLAPTLRAIQLGGWIGETAKLVFLDLFTVWCYLQKANCSGLLFLLFRDIADWYGVSFEELIRGFKEILENSDLTGLLGEKNIADESEHQLNRLLRSFSDSLCVDDLRFEREFIPDVCDRYFYFRSKIRAPSLLAILENRLDSLGNINSDISGKFDRNHLQRVYLITSSTYPSDDKAKEYAKQFRQQIEEIKKNLDVTTISIPTDSENPLPNELKNLTQPTASSQALYIQETFKPLILAILCMMKRYPDRKIMFRLTRRVGREKLGERKIFSVLDSTYLNLLREGDL